MNYLILCVTVFQIGLVASWIPPPTISVGLIGPQFTVDGRTNIPGRECIAAIVMAIREINNKTDGIADDILTKTTLKVALRSPRQTYLEAVSAALALARGVGSVFNGTGVYGVVGTSATDSSTATAKIFSNTDYKIPQISYGAQDSSLGHASIYQYFARTHSSDAYDGRVIARLIKNHFGWSTVTVLSSGDTYGNDISLEFEDEANKLDIVIESKSQFWSGILDFSSIITNILEAGGVLKVFVLLMKAEDAGRLLERGYNMGLFKEGTQILGSQYIAKADTFKYMSSDAPVQKILKGFIAISPTLTTARSSVAAQNFIKRFLSQKSTQYTDQLTERLVCDATEDDDGGRQYFMGYPKGYSVTAKPVCAGLDYSSYSSDGSKISDLAFYAYDATYAMARALHTVFYEMKISERNVTGTEIKWAILNNVSFTGVTGPIDFYKGNVGVDAYGQGDRSAGVDYQILQFDPRAYHALVNDGDGAWLSTGIWTSSNVFQPCNMKKDVLCSEWLFNTRDNSPPVDQAPIINVQMDTTTRTGLRVAGGILLVVGAFFFIVIELCSDTRLIKAAQPNMMKIVLVGGALACIRVILATVDLNTANCIVGKWIGHLAFALTFGALIMKIWRVNAVVNSGFRKVKVTEQHVQYLLGVLLVLFCLYLTADTLYSKPYQSYDETFDGHNIIRRIKCTNKRQGMTVALFVIEGVLLFMGARLCWNTKDAPGAVNDSRYIAMSMYLIVFVCSVTFPIVYFNITPTPATLMMIMAIGFIATTIGCSLLIFGPKTALLWEGADVDDRFEVVRNKLESNQAANGLQALKIKVSHKLSSGSGEGKTKSIVAAFGKESLKDPVSVRNREKDNKDKQQSNSESKVTDNIGGRSRYIFSNHSLDVPAPIQEDQSFRDDFVFKDM